MAGITRRMGRNTGSVRAYSARSKPADEIVVAIDDVKGGQPADNNGRDHDPLVDVQNGDDEGGDGVQHDFFDGLSLRYLRPLLYRGNRAGKARKSGPLDDLGPRP